MTRLATPAIAAVTEQRRVPAFAARPLKRVIQQRIENALASRLLTGEVAEGSHVAVDTKGRSFVFEATRHGGAGK